MSLPGRENEKMTDTNVLGTDQVAQERKRTKAF